MKLTLKNALTDQGELFLMIMSEWVLISGCQPELYLVQEFEGLLWGSLFGTLCFHCRGHEFRPLSGDQDPLCCEAQLKKERDFDPKL